jgi:hypothetical protein
LETSEKKIQKKPNPKPIFLRRAAAPLPLGDFIFLLAWPRYRSSLSEAGPLPSSSCTQDSPAQLSPSPRHLPLAARPEPPAAAPPLFLKTQKIKAAALSAPRHSLPSRPPIFPLSPGHPQEPPAAPTDDTAGAEMK